MAKSFLASQLDEVNQKLGQMGRLQENLERANRRILAASVKVQSVNQGRVAGAQSVGRTMSGGSGGGASGNGKTLIVLGKIASTLERIEKGGGLYMSTRTGGME